MSWLFNRNRVKPMMGDDKCSSMSSLSPTELDESTNQMLEIKPARNMFEYACRGNPITTSVRRTQLVKMVCIVMIPVVVLTGLTANTFIKTYTSYMSSSIRNTILFSVELGEVVHSLQNERDMSAVYISDISAVSKSYLLQIYQETDHTIEKLTFWTTLSQFEFQSKDKFISFLNKHRYELDTLNQTVTMELGFYTTRIRIFIKWLMDTMPEVEYGYIWRRLVAYLEIIIVKEYMGLERGLGMVFYAKGMFPSQDVYLEFSESQDMSNATFMSARRYSSLVYTLYNTIIKGNETILKVIGRMRAEIRRNDLAGHGSIKMAEWWYNNMTAYIGLLLETQSELSVEITGFIDERQKINLSTLIAFSIICVCVCVFCYLIIYAVYTMTNEIQKYSITLANRTITFNKEKKITETLLQQMLPKSVVDKLKANKVVDPENFTEATVFFSDIQGFTLLAASSSPVHVVQMLNKLYSCFDGTIAMFDVYKVETIGDAYVVVSGVPKRNSNQHSVEIASMALRLLDQVKCVDISHMPATKIKLRIGIHTGPVVAGVVGMKMPRYCLFGETVSIANKMESMGKSGRIHISRTTKEALQSLGRFNMEERQDDVCRRDGEMVMFLNGNVRTYWLTQLEEQSRPPTTNNCTENSF